MGVRGTSRDLTVMSVFDGYPAARCGIRVGDVIIGIDTMKRRGVGRPKKHRHIYGEPPITPIVITIRRPGSGEALRFELVRSLIEVKEVGYSAMLTDTIGYVRLLRFGRNSTRDLTMSIDSLKQQGMKSLILDLRQNPGGLLNAAIEVSQLFLNQHDLIVSTRESGYQRSTRSSIRILVPGFPDRWPFSSMKDRQVHRKSWQERCRITTVPSSSVAQRLEKDWYNRSDDYRAMLL